MDYITALRDELDKLLAENAALKKDNATMKDRIGSLERDAIEWNKAYEGMRAENLRFLRRINGLEDQVKQNDLDYNSLQARLSRLVTADVKESQQSEKLLECVRWYADRRKWFSDPADVFQDGWNNGFERAESCLRVLGLLEEAEESH